MIQVVCALIEDPRGRLLACKRRSDTHLAGHWEFPGGKVEADEAPQEALAREIREELDVGVEVGQAMEPVEWTDGDISICLRPYRCLLVNGDPHPHDHEEIRWCDAAQLEALHWAPADIPILREWLEGC